jgi:hypothetical protein
MVQTRRNAYRSSHVLIYSVNQVHPTETQTEMTRQFLTKLPSIDLHKDLFQGSAVAIHKQMGSEQRQNVNTLKTGQAMYA